jgi:uncharacterized membrane protein
VSEEGPNASIAYVAFLFVGVAVFTLLPLYFHARASRTSEDIDVSGEMEEIGEDA